MRILIVRHGDPDYKTDTLTERGRAQAEAVALRMQRSFCVLSVLKIGVCRSLYSRQPRLCRAAMRQLSTI